MNWGHAKLADPRPLLAELRLDLDAARQRMGLLEAVLASVDSAVLATDARGRRIFANAAADRLLPSLSRLPELLQSVESVAATGEAWASRLELPDERTLQVYLTPLKAGADGTGCVVVARDITATVRLETARRDFIAALSHELRTPLTSIQGYAELLQAELPLGPQAEYLEVVAQNAARLGRLARDLVTLSSIETGTYPFHFAALDVASLVAPALAVMAPLARERASRLRTGELAAGQVRGDRDALHRVLLNLVENALWHGGEGVEVVVTGRVAEGQYQLEVRDTGPGIGSNDQLRIFERFYRVDQSHSGLGGGKGTGLGLALVKHIVQEHGGEIGLRSALGQGSTFRVALPLFMEGPQ